MYTHPPPHVCTQSVHNPASVGGDQVRDRATAAKSGVEATWGRGHVGMGHTSELWTEPWGLVDRPCPAGASWQRTGEIQGLISILEHLRQDGKQGLCLRSYVMLALGSKTCTCHSGQVGVRLPLEYRKSMEHSRCQRPQILTHTQRHSSQLGKMLFLKANGPKGIVCMPVQCPCALLTGPVACLLEDVQSPCSVSLFSLGPQATGQWLH